MWDNDIEWAWFAGFFDGEGCILPSECWRKSTTKIGKPRYQVSVTLRIVQVDKAPLNRVQKIAGVGTIRERKKYKGWKKNWQKSYEWIAGGSQQIRPVLEQLRRFTTLKTPQIDAALELMDTFGSRGCIGNQHLSQNVIAGRQKIVAKIKKLKRTRIDATMKA